MAEVMWTPTEARAKETAMARFLRLASERHPDAGIDDYASLHRWSVEQSQAFWSLMLEFSEIEYEGSTTPVREGERMPGTRFFPGVELNFAENLLRFDDESVALISVSESRPVRRLTYADLRRRVARFAAGLRELGIGPGDRVAGFVPNVDEAVIAMLAATSLGAVWSSCSPDFGAQGVLDRFGQIAPRVLIAANAYTYNGKVFDCRERIQSIARSIDAIETVVLLPYVDGHPTDVPGVSTMAFDDFGPDDPPPLQLERQPFNHPLYVMYSSGTTGLPKSIVHGAGGTLLQHAKELALHSDLRRGDTIFYFTTCGWMMWNWLVSSLFVGATVVLYDGSPSHPDLGSMWRLVADQGVTHFGTSPKFLGSCRGQLVPKDEVDLGALRVLLSTGAPLLPEDFDWIYDAVKGDLQVASISGGTDIISCFMLGNPILPVHRGEIQCLGLGMDVAAFDDQRRPVVREKGELVCRTPFPSAPIYFWNDDDGQRYRSAYFSTDDGTWFHGDYIELTGSQGSAGGIVVYGRSDATLNPGGVRIGTAEIYRLVETLPQVADSIVVGQPHAGDVRVVLFVQLADGVEWNDGLEREIRQVIKAGATPRHVPARIVPVRAIPYTISGKKVELAVLEVISGKEPKNISALADPRALDAYRGLDLST